MGRVHDVSARRSWTNEEVLRYWQVALMRVEIAVRRTSWLQAMSKDPQEHSQVTTAIWGTMMDVPPLDSNGHLRPEAHRHARMFPSDVGLFQVISAAETFFVVWRGDWRDFV